jgi:hypothetical protein
VSKGKNIKVFRLMGKEVYHYADELLTYCQLETGEQQLYRGLKSYYTLCGKWFTPLSNAQVSEQEDVGGQLCKKCAASLYRFKPADIGRAIFKEGSNFDRHYRFLRLPESD